MTLRKPSSFDHLCTEMLKFYLVEAIHRPYGYLANNAQYLTFSGEAKTASINQENPFVQVDSDSRRTVYYIDITMFGYGYGYIRWQFGDQVNKSLDLSETDFTEQQQKEITTALMQVQPYF